MYTLQSLPSVRLVTHNTKITNENSQFWIFAACFIILTVLVLLEISETINKKVF